MLPSHHRSLGLTAGAVLLTTIAASGVISTSAAAAAATPTERVIIELTGASALTTLGETRAEQSRDGSGSEKRAASSAFRTLSSRVEAAQDSLITTAKSRGVSISKSKHITGVLNAIVGNVDPADLSSLRALPGVLRVTVDTQLHALEDTASTSTAVRAAGQEADAAAADPSAGEGSTVAILDTGIDYSLADLGGGFGEGFKVVDGYDFVNDDADPMDDHYHGTHVAGIAAGTGAGSVTGVAPGATLTAYKVLDETGSGQLSGILFGLEAASDPTGAHPADVINMSLGGDGDGTDPMSVAASTATLSGSLVVAAAGNSGPGETTIGAPAAAANVLSVGASITDFRVAVATVLGATKRELVTWRTVISANPPKRTVTADVVNVGQATEDDLAAAGDLTGKIVVYRGSAPASTAEYVGDALETARRVENTGAIAALVWAPSSVDETEGEQGPSFRGADAPAGSELDVAVAPSGADALVSGDDMRMDSLVMFGMSASEYSTFSASVDEGTAKIALSSTDATDRIAAFSSRGPTRYGAIKPEIVAPGYDIRSTVPVAQEVPGNAFRLSGTSMATPNVAGTAAIVSAERPDLDTAQVRALVIGSAVPLVGAAANLSPSIKGAGRADVAAASAASVIATPATLGFGQADATGDASSSLELSLQNLSDAELSARVEIQPSESSSGTLTLDDEDIVIDASGSATITATAKAKVGAADSELSGVLIVRLSDGTEVRVPYLQVSRHLAISSTPEPSSGEVQLMVESFLPLDAPPALTVTGATGKPFTVATKESKSMPGWFVAIISKPKVGVYKVAGAAETDGKRIAGTGSYEVVSSATTAKTWQQIGRNASSRQLEPSPVKSGTAMQLASTSVRPFATTNFGTTWTQSRSLPVADGWGTLIADPHKSKSYWYAVNGTEGKPPMDPSYQGKLLRTADLGKSWTVLPMPDKHMLAVASSGSKLAMVVDDGIEVSLDGGKSWKLIAYTWSTAVTDAVIQNGTLFVSSPSQVWRIGKVFGKSVAPEGVYASDQITGISGDSKILVVGASRGGVVISKDGGTTWKQTSADPERYTFGITVLRGEIFAGGLQGYFRSANNGKTWKEYDYPVTGVVAEDFDVWPGKSASLLLPLPQAGLYSSNNNGKSFRRLGVAATTVLSVLATTNAAGKSTVYVADEQGVGSAPLPGSGALASNVTEWGLTGGEARFGAAASDVEQDAVERNVLWRIRLDANNNAELQKTEDGGKTFTHVGPTTFGLRLNDIGASPTVSGHAAAAFSTSGERGIIVTHDGWDHWDTYNHPISIRGITIDPHDDSRMWLAADEGLYRSDDGGLTIHEVTDEETSTVFVDPNDENSIIAGGRGLWNSADGGKTFTQADAGGADMYISSVTSAVVTGKKGATSTILFAGSTTFRPGPLWVHGRGVLASVDGGATWKNVSAGIGTTSVTSLDTSTSGKWLLAGTRQGGLYRASIATLVKAAQ